MIRITAAVWTVLTVTLLSLGLVVSLQVSRKEREIRRLLEETREEQLRIQELHAEWSHLTRPDWLGPLVRAHTQMVPMDKRFMVALADLPMRQSPLEVPDAIGALILQVSAEPAAAAAATGAGTAPRARPQQAQQQQQQERRARTRNAVAAAPTRKPAKPAGKPQVARTPRTRPPAGPDEDAIGALIQQSLKGQP